MTLRPWMLGATLALMMASIAHAQSVFKCTVAGQTVYQSTPCAGEGRVVPIAAGPSEAQAQEARQRAEADKSRAGTYKAPPVAAPGQGQAVAGPRYDCAALNQQRGEAFGRRNAAIRSSRETNMDHSDVVSQQVGRIRSIEQKMVQGGCQPN